MTLSIQLLDPKNRSQDSDLERLWEDFVYQHPHASFYHQLGWKCIIEETFRRKPLYLCALKNQKVTGVLPLFIVGNKLFGRALVSLPYSNYGGILAEDEPTRKALLQEARKWGNKLGASYLLLKSKKASDLKLTADDSYCTYILELDSDPEVVFIRSLKTKTRNQIRKAQKLGLQIRKGRDLFSLFYKIYALNTRDLGSPIYSPDFFLYTMRQFPDQTEIFVVFQGTTAIGGLFFQGWQKTASAPAASSLRAYWSLCPNNILYWSVIQYACQKGYHFFDFGRSIKESGPALFKKQWGGVEVDLLYEYDLYKQKKKPSWDPNQGKFRFLTSLWKKIPLELTIQLGPRLIRYIP